MLVPCAPNAGISSDQSRDELMPTNPKSAQVTRYVSVNLEKVRRICNKLSIYAGSTCSRFCKCLKADGACLP